VTAYVRPADVAVVVEDADADVGATVYLATLPDGPVQVLNGVASLIWLEATAAKAEDDVHERVAALVDQAPDLIRADVESFVDQLVRSGLLERVER
jgi:coenzyme PQQ synthesis protein D (PqqD)